LELGLRLFTRLSFNARGFWIFKLTLLTSEALWIFKLTPLTSEALWIFKLTFIYARGLIIQVIANRQSLKKIEFIIGAKKKSSQFTLSRLTKKRVAAIFSYESRLLGEIRKAL
jgi:hypothetical protein